MKLTITQEDIDKAIEEYSNNGVLLCCICPVAQAMKRQNILENPFVDSFGVKEVKSLNPIELSKTKFIHSSVLKKLVNFPVQYFIPGEYELEEI
jgi:hypothetical protein